jgi:hypothetical protein
VSSVGNGSDTRVAFVTLINRNRFKVHSASSGWYEIAILRRAKQPRTLTPDRILEKIPTVASPPLETTPRCWAQALARYREPNHVRSIVEIAITAAPLATLWVLAWAALHFDYWWLSLLLAIPAAGFLVRFLLSGPSIPPKGGILIARATLPAAINLC